MIVTVGPRQAAVLADQPTAVYRWVRVVTETSPSAPLRLSDPVRVTVEILRRTGGLLPRALVGGSLTPGTGDVVIQVGVSGHDLDGEAKVVSQLWRPLVAGLPAEFAPAVVDGLRRRPLPAGRLVVDRAGHDPVESSPLAFELAAELLATVVTSRAVSGDVESAVRAAVEAWP